MKTSPGHAARHWKVISSGAGCHIASNSGGGRHQRCPSMLGRRADSGGPLIPRRRSEVVRHLCDHDASVVVVNNLLPCVRATEADVSRRPTAPAPLEERRAFAIAIPAFHPPDCRPSPQRGDGCHQAKWTGVATTGVWSRQTLTGVQAVRERGDGASSLCPGEPRRGCDRHRMSQLGAACPGTGVGSR
jgi:hypothetical protein